MDLNIAYSLSTDELRQFLNDEDVDTEGLNRQEMLSIIEKMRQEEE